MSTHRGIVLYEIQNNVGIIFFPIFTWINSLLKTLQLYLVIQIFTATLLHATILCRLLQITNPLISAKKIPLFHFFTMVSVMLRIMLNLIFLLYFIILSIYAFLNIIFTDLSAVPISFFQHRYKFCHPEQRINSEANPFFLPLT